MSRESWAFIHHICLAAFFTAGCIGCCEWSLQRISRASSKALCGAHVARSSRLGGYVEDPPAMDPQFIQQMVWHPFFWLEKVLSLLTMVIPNRPRINRAKSYNIDKNRTVECSTVSTGFSSSSDKMLVPRYFLKVIQSCRVVESHDPYTRGGFKYYLLLPLFGKGWNHQPKYRKNFTTVNQCPKRTMGLQDFFAFFLAR